MGLLGAAAPGILPFNALEIVSLVHAVIVGWNAVMAALWAVIAGVFNLPVFPPELISAAVFGFSLSTTWAYTIIINEWGKHHGWLQTGAFGIRVLAAFIQGPLFAVFVFTMYPGWIFWMALIPLMAILLNSLIRFPNFRSGFLILLGFLGLLEVCYLISTETVREAFDSFVCERQNVGLPQCS